MNNSEKFVNGFNKFSELSTFFKSINFFNKILNLHYFKLFFECYLKHIPGVILFLTLESKFLRYDLI